MRTRRHDHLTIAARAEAGRLERPGAVRPVPVFETGSSSSRVASSPAAEGARLELARAQPRTRLATGLLIRPDPFRELQLRAGLARPRRHDSNVRRPPSEGGALSTELRRGGVDGRGRTCTLRLRRPVPSPLDYVDEWRHRLLAPEARSSDLRPEPLFERRVFRGSGLEPVAFCSTGSCSDR